MKNINWQYIAGFFDGEGSITHNSKGFRITISQTNKNVLDTIRLYTNIGNVFETTKRKEHWKDSWVYYIAKQTDVYTFLKRTEKFLIVKEKQTKTTILGLENIIKKQKKRKKRMENLIKQTKKLRNQGLTYRQIGKKLNIDFGYARRLYIKK